MNNTAEDEKVGPRLQFPLWLLMFILPTIAGLLFAIYANQRRQQKVYEDLVALQVGLIEQQQEITQLRTNWNHLQTDMQQNLQEFKDPEKVMARLHHPLIPPMNPNDGSSGYYEIEDASDFLFFFVQANDDDVRALFSQMQEQYPKASHITQFQVLNLLARLPEFAPDRMDVIAAEVKRFVEPLKEQKNQALASQAKAVWKTFGFAQVSEPMANGEGQP